IPGFLGYAFVLFSGTMLAIRGARATHGGTLDERTAAAAAAAVSAALLWSDAAGDAHYGLNGLLFWLALGIGSLALKSLPMAAPKRSAAGVRRAFVRARS
ncbi:MAG: hypothetical protein IAI50_12535, partial [Candidatus Eremiobacteraeota bacterium]|nr:hypothetical protein [Candidatus Eremiobacteraeota bacterium]